jgi:hypothetical protein
MSAPIGNPHAGVQMVDIGSTPMPAGRPVYCDEETGEIGLSGTSVFLGIVIADGASGRAALATQGIVPVRLQPPGDGSGILVGNIALCLGGDDFCIGITPKEYEKYSGDQSARNRTVGVIQQAYDGTDIVMIPVRIGAAPPLPKIFRLQILDASESGTDKVRVRLGKCGGYLADSTMDDPGDTTPFIYVLSGTGARHIYAQMPMTYLSNGIWEVSADGTIGDAASVPANDASYYYVDLGSVDAPGDGTGVTVTNPQPVSGDQRISRIGNSTDWVDSNSSISEP